MLKAMRALLPMRPSEPEVKLTIAPEPVAALRLPRVRSAEFTPVPPVPTVIVERPSARVTLPSVSVETVCARPR